MGTLFRSSPKFVHFRLVFFLRIRDLKFKNDLFLQGTLASWVPYNVLDSCRGHLLIGVGNHFCGGCILKIHRMVFSRNKETSANARYRALLSSELNKQPVTI